MSWSDFTEAEIRSPRAVVGDGDIAVGGRRRLDDEEAERRAVSAAAAGGATWWLEFVPPTDASTMLAAVERGPIRGLPPGALSTGDPAGHAPP
ncbi:hypothetical protein KIH74_11790 [Kineosporia sp. J2-2]|uniref:Uncharacterized protein n=1 Tax=Kineosporia corallincola TaxID=2835133 RepID=A0ABS5TEU1_9ACTN|nr:hypothetical protein [Kineosporia corallincola]MBT0769608.1 hypothetical protein [Kineosporia corallincola]